MNLEKVRGGMCGDIFLFSNENYLIFVRNVLLKPIPSSTQGNIVIIKYIKGIWAPWPCSSCHVRSVQQSSVLFHTRTSPVLLLASPQDSGDTLFPCPCLFVNRKYSFPLCHLHGCVVVGSGLEYKFHSLVLCFQPTENPAYLIRVFCHSSGRKATHCSSTAAPSRFPAFLCV